MPPQAATEVQVAQFAAPAEPLPPAAADEPPAAAALLEELELELELLQPAASKIDPTAATVAAIAFDARN